MLAKRPEPVFPGSGRFRIPGASVALLLAAMAGFAQGPYAQPPLARPAVSITAGRTAATPWTVELDLEKGSLRATHKDYPKLAFEIDADGPEDDHHYEGITPVFGTERMEGRLYRDTVSFLSPDHDAGRTGRVQLEALDLHLRIRFEGGSYRELNPGGPDEPVFFEAVFWFDKTHRLQVSLNGLYYIFPSATGTRAFVFRRSGQAAREFNAGTPKGYEYFEEVIRVDVEDALHGKFRVDGLIQRMQLHAHGAKNADVFEIDMDHSYKDRGQKEVLTRLQFLEPFETVTAPAKPETTR